MTDQTEGKARSVHTRLVSLAKSEGFDSTFVFTRYGVERFLYRLSESPHADRFVLKGALYPSLYRLKKRGLLDAEWRVTDQG